MPTVLYSNARLILLQRASEKLSELGSHVETQDSSADQLPIHVWGDILSCVSNCADISTLSRTCRTLRALCNDPHVQASWLLHHHSTRALHLALRRPTRTQLSLVHALINQGADANSIDNAERRSVLHVAAERGHISTLAMLMEAGAQIDLQDSYGQLPLHVAAARGRPAAVQTLLDAAQSSGRPVRVFLSSRDTNGATPLHAACSGSDEGSEVVELLVDAGAPLQVVDSEGLSPMLVACKHGKVEAVHALRGAEQRGIAEDAEDSSSSWIPLLLDASLAGRSSVIRALQVAGFDIRSVLSREAALLHVPCQLGFEECVTLLLDSGSPVNIPDIETGDTALHMAAFNGHASIAKKLLAHGANVDAVNLSGNSPLHNAASQGHEAIVNLLLRAGSQASACNKVGNTPLHCAADKPGQAPCVRQLLAAGASPQASGAQGYTPLHFACLRGDLDIVKMLLDAGSDPQAPAGSALITPLSLATKRGHHEVVCVLQQVQRPSSSTPLNSSRKPVMQGAYFLR